MNAPELFDSHAHLDLSLDPSELAAVLRRARAASVNEIAVIGAGRGVEGAFDAVSLAARDPHLWATVGVHPHDADLGVAWSGDPAAPVAAEVRARFEEAAGLALARLESLSLHPKVVALGEVGLDFHYDHSPRELQRELFRRFVRLACRRGLPLVIHAREAEDEVAAILEAEGARQVGGVIHCFSGHAGLAKAALDMGFSFGLTGVLTFPKAHALASCARTLPLGRLLVETDSPYLAPVPYRGKRNEPAFVVEVARRLSELRGLSFAEVANATTANARALFGLEARTRKLQGRVAYRFGGGLYLNITNRCTLACAFCLKRTGHNLGNVNLALPTEPSAEEVLAAALALAEPGEEIVFCGIGEPLLRPDVVLAVGRELRARGFEVRVNTDGLASLVHGRDIAAELQDAVDRYSVSLNAPDPETHSRLCPSVFGPSAFEAVSDFVRRAQSLTGQVAVTAVRTPGLDLEAVRRKAEELGVPFRARG